MKKRIAVMVRGRQAEALRMSIGLTVLDDEIGVFILDRAFIEADDVKFNLEMIRELGIGIYTNYTQGRYGEVITSPEIAERLLGYDHILTY